jgi:hypothetical protein
MKIAPLLAIVLMAGSCGNGTKPPDPPPVDPPPQESTYVTLAGKRLAVEWVRTDPQRIERLAERAALRDMGVLIGYGHDRILYHHTGSGGPDADIAWLSKDGRIVELAHLKGGSSEGVTSTMLARYALATPVGWLAARGAKVGDTVEFSAEIAAFPAEPLPEIKVGGVAVRVEVSEHSAERQRGLMYRKRLAGGDGMLFMYAGCDPHGFWMGHCYFGLDIAYFDADRKLLNVVPMDPYPDPDSDPGDRAYSKAPAQFVLEVNKGWFAANGLVDKEGNAKDGVVLELPEAVVKMLEQADP